MLVCIVTDNLYRVLVSTYGAVSTETEEFALLNRSTSERHFFYSREREICYIVNDTQCEVVLRLVKLEVVINGDNFCRSNFARTETEATTNDKRTIFYIVVCSHYIEVERLTLTARLLGTVKNCNLLTGLRHGREEILYRERTIEVNIHHTYLLAL